MSKWPMVALGEIASVVSGATPKTSVGEYWDGDVLWATPKDLSGLGTMTISSTNRQLSEAGLQSCSTHVLPIGSVLLSSRAPIGLVAVNTVPMATNQGFKSLTPQRDRLDATYLYHWLTSNRSFLESIGTGATFKEISKKRVQSVEIPLPPLDEQRRIAAVLDRSARHLSATTRSLNLISEFGRQSFTKLFGRPSSWADRWPMAKIGDIADSTQYGTSERASTSGPAPVLRMGNLTTDGRLDLSDLKYMTLAEKDRSKHTVRRGDILFNRTNSPDLVGKTAVVRTDDEYAYAGYLIRVRVSEDADPEFVAGYLNSEYGKILLRSMCKSIVGQANINATELRNIPIAVPPRALQSKFAEVVAKVEEERARIDERGRVLKSLHASLQSRAFRGEL